MVGPFNLSNARQIPDGVGGSGKGGLGIDIIKDLRFNLLAGQRIPLPVNLSHLCFSLLFDFVGITPASQSGSGSPTICNE